MVTDGPGLISATLTSTPCWARVSSMTPAVAWCTSVTAPADTPAANSPVSGRLQDGDIGLALSGSEPGSGASSASLGLRGDLRFSSAGGVSTSEGVTTVGGASSRVAVEFDGESGSRRKGGTSSDFGGSLRSRGESEFGSDSRKCPNSRLSVPSWRDARLSRAMRTTAPLPRPTAVPPPLAALAPPLAVAPANFPRMRWTGT